MATEKENTGTTTEAETDKDAKPVKKTKEESAEKKPSAKKEKASKKTTAIEKTYTIPFRSILKAPVTKRAKMVSSLIKKFLKKHTKIGNIKISPELNEEIWGRGREKPPRKLKVKVSIELEEGKAVVTLA